MESILIEKTIHPIGLIREKNLEIILCNPMFLKWLKEERGVDFKENMSLYSFEKQLKKEIRGCIMSCGTLIHIEREEYIKIIYEYIQEMEIIIIICTPLEKKDVLMNHDHFLSKIGHELRTPLNSIIGFGQLLSHSRNITDDEKRYLNTIIHSTKHLSKLIEDLMKFKEIEKGDEIQNAMKYHSAHRLISIAVDMMKCHANEKNIDLYYIPCPEEYAICVSETHFTEILLNLIQNSIQYMGKENGGEIFVYSRDRKNHIEIVVRDNGTGIEANKIRYVLDNQPKILYDEKKHIGLYLCRTFIENMEGIFCIESVVGNGTSASIILPRYSIDSISVDCENEKKVEYEKKRTMVLYVEDDLNSIELLKDIFLIHLPHLTLRFCTLGKDAKEEISNHSDDIALLLFDYYLPDTNGEELYNWVKREKKLYIPTFILSAETSKFVRMRLNLLGIKKFITKPIDIPNFVSTIQEVLDT